MLVSQSPLLCPILLIIITWTTEVVLCVYSLCITILTKYIDFARHQDMHYRYIFGIRELYVSVYVLTLIWMFLKCFASRSYVPENNSKLTTHSSDRPWKPIHCSRSRFQLYDFNIISVIICPTISILIGHLSLKSGSDVKTNKNIRIDVKLPLQYLLSLARFSTSTDKPIKQWNISYRPLSYDIGHVIMKLAGRDSVINIV